VNSLLNQTFTSDDFEVIVVNDAGNSLPDMDWQQSPKMRVIATNRRERCVARNAGATIARGRYLCFLDDDDWFLPDALDHFWQLADWAKDAVWLYGGLRIVDETGTNLAEVNSGLNGNCFAQIMGGAWAPIQASLIKTTMFFKVGGYNTSIIGTEDLDLCRRIALRGDFANTSAPVACLLRGPTWNTSTDYLRAPADTLRSRDDILGEQGSIQRLISSAGSSYWYGRIFRVYLSTVRFNLRQRKLFTAVSRGIFGLMSFVLAGRHSLTRDYWQAVKADHPPNTLHFIIKAMEQEIQDNSDSMVDSMPGAR
jgi:glycosyltransferase involved in cell wall biosynthesis